MYACNDQGRIQDFRKGGGTEAKIRLAQPKIRGDRKTFSHKKGLKIIKKIPKKGARTPMFPLNPTLMMFTFDFIPTTQQTR